MAFLSFSVIVSVFSCRTYQLPSRIFLVTFGELIASVFPHRNLEFFLNGGKQKQSLFYNLGHSEESGVELAELILSFSLLDEGSAFSIRNAQ